MSSHFLPALMGCCIPCRWPDMSGDTGWRSGQSHGQATPSGMMPSTGLTLALLM